MQNTGAESSTEENPEAIGEDAEDPPPFRAVHELILKPWGIGGTRAPSATAPATLYSPGFGPGPVLRHRLHKAHPRNLSCYAGSMAFFSTPSDLARFGLAMNGGTLLHPATVRLLQTSQPLTAGQETGNGLGWELETGTLAGAPAQAAGHDGELRGGTVIRTLTRHGISDGATYA